MRGEKGLAILIGLPLFAEGQGREVLVAFEQRDEVFVVLVAERFRNFRNGLVGEPQQLLGVGDALLNDVRLQPQPDVFFEIPRQDVGVDGKFFREGFQGEAGAEGAVDFVENVQDNFGYLVFRVGGRGFEQEQFGDNLRQDAERQDVRLRGGRLVDAVQAEQEPADGV